jgi:hydroxymethylbilane synthase
LGLADKITEIIPIEISLPAVGQGALGIETRIENKEVEDRVSFLNDPSSAISISAERAFLKRLGGGCQVPVAAFGQMAGPDLKIDGMVGTIDGKSLIRHSVRGSVERAEWLGVELAEILLKNGADKILEEVYQRSGPTIQI